MQEQTSSSQDQIYTPLEKRQIRLLIVHPGIFDDPLNCNLMICSLDEKPSYSALSYTWGGLGETKYITLESTVWGITANLEQALLHLRPSNKDLSLWVDAICINQNNYQEKACQVEMMGDIYRFAACVRAWIGPAEDNKIDSKAEGTESMEPFQGEKWDVWKILRVFGTSQKFDCWDGKLPYQLKEGLAKTEMLSYMAESWAENCGKKAWETMAQLLNRPYWKRVWIQQELYNNPEVLIHCGHNSAPLEWWARASEVYDDLAASNNHIGGLSLPSKYFSAAAAAMKSCTQRRRFYDRLGSEHHVVLLLRDQLSRGVTDPRDRIYGTLDMIECWHGGKFEVDYNHSPPQVYSRAVQSLVRFWNSLNILTGIYPRPVHTRLEGLPTWCPDWSNFPISRYPDQAPDLEFIVTEHNLNVWGDNKYDASPKAECFSKFSECGMILTVNGIIVDILRDVVNSPYSAVKAAQAVLSYEDVERIIDITKAESDSSRRETLWRTLVSNRDWIHDASIHPYNKPAFKSAPAELGTRFDSWIAFLKLQQAELNTSNDKLSKSLENPETIAFKLAQRVLPADKQPSPELSSTEVVDHIVSWMLPFIRACQIATTHRRFFLTQEDNMGLAPLHARPGDIVVILYGCALPVILRPIEEHFEFVGQAYIHGWMTGEAVDHAEQGKFAEKAFVIH